MVEYQLNQKDYDDRMHSKSAFRIFLCKLFGLLIQIIFSNEIRIQMARAMGIKVGKKVYIGKYCIIDDTFSNLITIEDNVVISFGATITAHDASNNKVAPVVIKKGAFIGARSIILPGVTLAENSIVGAGSVVTRDVSRGKVVVGCPAREIKKNEL